MIANHFKRSINEWIFIITGKELVEKTFKVKKTGKAFFFNILKMIE